MIIQHNMLAMNSQRNLGINTKKRAKSAEKLSSGYRINRAADNASGLSISEKMRAQIRGLERGMDNIQNGISLLNVADGALEEVHDMLHRMRELAIQAANDTNTASDREAIDLEIQQLKAEIDRIGKTTEFNTRRVFPETGDPFTETIIPTATGAFFALLGNNATHTGYMDEFLAMDKLQSLPNTGYNTASSTNPYVSVHIDFGQLIDKDNNIKALAGTQFYVNCCTNCCPNTIVFTDEVGFSKSGKEIHIGLKKADGEYYTSAEEFCKAIIEAGNIVSSNHVEYAYEGSVLYIYDIDNNSWSEHAKQLAYFCDEPDIDVSASSSDYGLLIQMGSNSNQTMTIRLSEVSTKILGIRGDNCLTFDNAEELIKNLDYANEAVSALRSCIGAYVNRLEHGYNANANTHENTAAAESKIRDADMASEMVEAVKLSILEQIGNAMLVQANHSRQNVLDLLS